MFEQCSHKYSHHSFSGITTTVHMPQGSSLTQTGGGVHQHVTPHLLPLRPNMGIPDVLLGLPWQRVTWESACFTRSSPHPAAGGLFWKEERRVTPESNQFVDVWWVCGSVIGCALVKYIPQALSLNINCQSIYPVHRAKCWHANTPRNASQDPERPPHHCQVLGQSWCTMWHDLCDQKKF